MLGPGGPTEVAPPSSLLGFPGGSAGKKPDCNVGDLGLIGGLGRSAGEGKGSPLQYSCLETPMDRGAWNQKGSDMAEAT